MENIVVVWLDEIADEDNNDANNLKSHLSQITRILRTFSDPEKCIQWISETTNEKIFLIVSGRHSETILERSELYSQLVVIYIYCQQKFNYEYLIDRYSKLKGVDADLLTICQNLKFDFKQWENDLSTFQIISLNDIEQFNSEQLSFVHNQLFQEYLLEIDYSNHTRNEFINFCKTVYVENKQELKLIEQFENSYDSNHALYWYTKDCFIYHMLNKAIRIKDVRILFQMGFLIRDINQQIKNQCSKESKLTLYRGQG